MVVGQHVGRVKPGQRLAMGVLEQPRRADGQRNIHPRNIVLQALAQPAAELAVGKAPQDGVIGESPEGRRLDSVVLEEGVGFIRADDERAGQTRLDSLDAVVLQTTG